MSPWLEIPIEAYSVAKELGLWERFLNLFRKKRRVLVLGASGAGKTQFVESLMGRSERAAPGYRRTSSVRRRSMAIGNSPFIVIDTPGQRFDEAKRKEEIKEAIRRPVDGVVNVVCFGYHEAEESGGRDAFPAAPGRIAKADYLKRRQQVEIELLSEWVPLFLDDTAGWVLTVVTKADLWWPDTGEQIRKTYEAGTYATQLERFSAKHSVLPYCSIIEPFYGTRTGGRFGDHHKWALRSMLLETILQRCGVTE